MSELWFCMDCEFIGPLDKHLRCRRCFGDSVAIAYSIKAVQPDWNDWLRRELEEAYKENN